MKLHEYQVKKLLTDYGLSTPLGCICTSLNEIEGAISKVGLGPWIMKCQIHAGSRKKAGGIKFVRCRKEVHTFVKYWLGKRLITCQTGSVGYPVNQILIEEVINITKELYLSITVDYSSYCVVFLASNKGGIKIEEIIEKTPNLLLKVTIDLLVGPMPYQGRELAFKLGLKGNLAKEFTIIFMRLINIFLDFDLVLIEINPLVITPRGNFVCLDGKLIVDNNALFRQKKLCKMRDYTQENFHEIQASKWNLNYISLNGNIGCIVNGAGLAMNTMDMIKLYGGDLANFLDIGGNATKESVIEAFRIILSNKNIKVILVNIFGGIVCCNLIADAIICAVKEIGIIIPIVVRLEGNNSKLAIKKITVSGSTLNIILEKNLTNLAKTVVFESKK